MGDDKRFEMMKTLKGRQDKFIYYIVGLNVASIGFTLSKTFEITPNRTYDIFLALALLCWVISTTASFRWIYIQFRTMETNIDLGDLIDGFYDKDKYNDAQRKELFLKSKSRLLKDASKCRWAINVTILFFIIGIILFVIWRIFDAFQIPMSI
jgi:hypothetical protein